MRSSSSKAEACAVAVWRTVVRTALNAVVGIFFDLLHEKQARTFFKDLKFDVVVETRSSSSEAEACAAAVWRTVVKTALNAVIFKKQAEEFCTFCSAVKSPKRSLV
jgi:hypothetical protein